MQAGGLMASLLGLLSEFTCLASIQRVAWGFNCSGNVTTQSDGTHVATKASRSSDRTVCRFDMQKQPIELIGFICGMLKLPVYRKSKHAVVTGRLARNIWLVTEL